MLGLLALALTLHAESLPYNPTSILRSPNSSLVYIFEPSSGSTGQAQLSALDFSETIDASTRRSAAISESLPFLQEGEPIPYTPTIDTDGNITVIAGNCSQGANGTEVWRFVPNLSHSELSGSWSRNGATTQDGGSGLDATGPNYLGNIIAFSGTVGADAANTNLYTFGGMCPYGNSTPETWITDAEYTNLILTMEPPNNDRKGYQIDVVPDRGPPISQAGASITALLPTYSMRSSDASQMQQQNFVLIGGHTQTAFINTSNVALFSLPQQSWAFVPIRQPSSGKTDLAARQSELEVSPRSGHTAILSESGDRIIVFGGWVGDVDTPAEPQLAVLDLGSGYGGSADWRWTIPPTPEKGPGLGAGIYGHGATMLPGGVMMVLGGYDIASAASRRLRQRSQITNDRMLLYNTTSNSWLDSYTPPGSVAQQSQGQIGPLQTYSQKVGLGTGLGIGAALLVSVVVFYFWYSKRLKRAREERERALISYSTEGSSLGQLDQPFLNKGGIDGRGDEAVLGRIWPTGGAAGNEDSRPEPMQHTTGLFVNVPSPTRGLRKGTANKNYQYHAAPRYDEKRLSRGIGPIHPIAEHEDEDEQDAAGGRADREGLSDAEWKLRELERVLNSDDPFKDPEPNPLRSHPVSPETEGDTICPVMTTVSRKPVPIARPLSGEQAAFNWIAEPNTQAENQHGRVSPTKSDDRTSSTLSERSQRSTASSNSICRTMSTRTGAVMAAAAAAHRLAGSRENSPTDERIQTMSTDGGRQSPSYFRTRARSSTNGSVTAGAPLSAGGDAESFRTAKSTFAQLQSEGEALLGGRPRLDLDDPYQRALAATTSTRANTLTTLSESGPPLIILPRRRQGWMGSLRRALNAVSGSERSVSLTTSSERYRDDLRSASSSPTKDRKIGSSPRRAVSDGGALLSQKRGQRDWNEKDWPPYRDDPDPGDWGEPRTSSDQREAENDWDVEGAAGKRDVQVMFTVPKARLRVVNDDMDRASLRSASESAISRNGSIKTVRREDSMKALKARPDGDNWLLPATEEEKEESEKVKAA